MDREGIDCFHIERGGMSHITAPDNLWHIRYLTLKATGWGVKGYVNLLEESVIRTIAQYGITGGRIEGASGVWVGEKAGCEKNLRLGRKMLSLLHHAWTGIECKHRFIGFFNDKSMWIHRQRSDVYENRNRQDLGF